MLPTRPDSGTNGIDRHGVRTPGRAVPDRQPGTTSVEPDRSPAAPLPAWRPGATARTSFLFRALLALAFCLGVLGFARHGTSAPVDPGSPDAPPPPVLVQTD